MTDFKVGDLIQAEAEYANIWRAGDLFIVEEGRGRRFYCRRRTPAFSGIYGGTREGFDTDGPAFMLYPWKLVAHLG